MLLPIFRRGNDDGFFSLCSAPLLIGILSTALLVVQTAGQMGSSSSSDVEYEIVLPVSSTDLSSPLLMPPRTLNWQGEWVRRFSPRVVMQNGWKYRSFPRSDLIGGGVNADAHHQRIVMEKKWSALEPSIRFL